MEPEFKTCVFKRRATSARLSLVPDLTLQVSGGFVGIGNLFLPGLKVSADAAGSLPRKDKSHFAGRGSSADKRQGSFGVSHP